MSDRASSVLGVLFGRQGESGKKAAKPIRVGFALQIAFWLLVAVALAAGAVYGGWTALGRPQIDSEAEKLPTALLLDLVRISLTIVAGVGGIVALVVAYRKQRLGEAQHQREEAGSRREDQKLYSERFSKASELLGSDRSALRLAAVYALGRLADDWEGGRQMCIDVLCAYLRMPHKPLNPPPIDEIIRKEYRPFERQAWRAALLDATTLNPSEEHQVRSTIIRVIVEHLHPDATAPWFGHSFNLSGALLDSPNFTDAHFRDCFVDFSDSFLYGEIQFSGAQFVDSEIDFISAIIGGQCSLEVCEFKNSKIGLTADIITGGGIKFYYSRMEDTTVELYGLELDGGDFSFMEILMKNSKLTVGTAQIRNGSTFVLSRTHIGENSRITIRDADFADSALYLSGLRIEKGGQVVFSTHVNNHPNSPDSGPTLTNSEIYLNDVNISNGFLGFRCQHFVQTPLHWDYLHLSNAELIVTQSKLVNSPISFTESIREEGSRLVVDVCSEDAEPVRLSGLSEPSTGEGTSINIRSGEVGDVNRALWTQPRTQIDLGSDTVIRPRVDAWY